MDPDTLSQNWKNGKSTRHLGYDKSRDFKRLFFSNQCIDPLVRSLFDYVWKPKTVEDSIDAGVHPAVAELRRKEADKQRTVTDPWCGGINMCKNDEPWGGLSILKLRPIGI